MSRSFEEALINRRSYYAIKNETPISDLEIEHIVHTAVKHVPSAFNSQSARLVLLLGDNHRKLWGIVKDTLKKMLSSEAYAQSEAKIDGCFSCGYGTVLFFEDDSVVKGLQDAFPAYATNFPVWSMHTSAMHQLAVWMMLEDVGLGASLQHYNPIIDEEVAATWHLPASWKLVAQMPFGSPAGEPGPKEFQTLETRVKVFK